MIHSGIKNPRVRSNLPEYQTQKAKAVQEYLTTDKTAREVEKETGISRSVISKETRKNIEDNKAKFQEMVDESKFIIAYNNALVINSLDKIEVNSLDDIVKITDINQKTQKLINLVEGVTAVDSLIPSNINIQVINNNKNT